MILPDVNVLVYAHREDAPKHAAYRGWLEALINGDQAYGMVDLVLSGFLRVVTHPRVFNPTSTPTWPSPLGHFRGTVQNCERKGESRTRCLLGCPRH
jgi:predicted nucleic acid-binding protein